MTTPTKQHAMSAAEFADCDLHSGADLARIRAALEQRERLLEVCKAADRELSRLGATLYDREKLRAAIAAAEGRQ